MLHAWTCTRCELTNPGEFAFCWTCGAFARDPRLAAAPRRLRAWAAGIDLGVGLLLYEAYQLAPVELSLAAGLAGAGYVALSLHLMGRGQTPGKRLVGLWVVDRHGRPVGLARHLLLRTPLWWCCTAVGILAWFAGMFGGRTASLVMTGMPELSGAVDNDTTPGPLDVLQGQALHDRMAGTYVVLLARR